MYKYLIRPILFLFDPERVHHFTFTLLRNLTRLGCGSVFRSIWQVRDSRLEREVFGLKFKNPVGLAAGFDKDARLFTELDNVGFGFIEIGTVTPKPQAGNPKKRLFRLKSDKAIVNRMGFNNEGVAVAAERLKANKNVLVGGNIGKNKTTPNAEAVQDYILCFNALFDVVDYFVVNVSSPNTPGLRELQDKEPLTQLLMTLKEENSKRPSPKPILLKIAPDLTDEQLLDIIAIVKETKLDGVIATNTTISREGIVSENKKEAGGLSGKPLMQRSTEVIRFLATQSNNGFPIIGVGGIHSVQDALDKFEAGAALVQLYTGFIYEGPGLIKAINKALMKRAQ